MEYINEKQANEIAEKIMKLDDAGKLFVLKIVCRGIGTNQINGLEVIFDKWDILKNTLKDK